MAPVNSGVHRGNNFTENNPQFQHVTSKTFASPFLGRKTSKNIGLKKLQFISITGMPYYWLARGTHISRTGPYLGYKKTYLQRNHKILEIFVANKIPPYTGIFAQKFFTLRN
jgi:hypothetical protein